MAPSGKKRGPPPSAKPTTWYAVQSEQHGREYYFNPETNESTWILPDDAHPHPSQEIYNTTDDNNASPSSLEEEYIDDDMDGCGDASRESHSTYLPRWIRVQRRNFSKRRRSVMLVATISMLFLLAAIAVMLAPISRVHRERVLTFFGKRGLSSPFLEESKIHNKIQSTLEGSQEANEKDLPSTTNSERIPLAPTKEDANDPGTRVGAEVHDPEPAAGKLPQAAVHINSRPTQLGEDMLRSLESHLQQTLGVDVQKGDDSVVLIEREPTMPSNDSSCLIPFGHLLLKRCRNRPASFDAEDFVLSILQ